MKKRNRVSKITKTLPLAVAATMLSTGAAFADTDVIKVMVNGTEYTFDVQKIMTDTDYATTARNVVTDAFTESKPFLISASDSQGEELWIDFGSNAKEGVDLQEMIENPQYYAPEEEETVY